MNQAQTVSHSRDLNFPQVVARYQSLRKLSMSINNKLVMGLSKETMVEGASKLGMLEGHTIVLPTEDMSSVLLDYCIYHVYRDGRNRLDEYLIARSPEPGTDEHVCLHAMQHSQYCLLRIESIEPNTGAWIHVLGSQGTRLLVDLGLAASAELGWIMATRLLAMENFCCTSGAPLLIGMAHSRRTKAIVKRGTTLLKEQKIPDPAPIMRQLMGSEAVLRTAYC
jgi:hypothetical protein